MAREKRRGNSEGAIYQRQSDGRWVAALSLPNGGRKSFYAKSRKEAVEKLKAAMKDLDDGRDLSPGRMTLAQYLDKWLSASVKPSVKVKTYEGYESIVRVRVAPRMGRKSLSGVTPLDLQSLYADLAASGLSNRSIHHTHRCLHRAFVQAVRWNLLSRNPCDGVTPPRPERVQMKVWTPDEASAFLSATPEYPAHTLYVLAITTGMRQGELLGLRWQDVDLDAGTLAVRRALQRQRGNGLVFVEPKTARSRRTIVLSQRAITALRLHHDRQEWARKKAGSEWQDSDLVFCDHFGAPLDPSYQTANFKAALRDAGLPPIRFHDLRHTAATLLLSRGVHVKLVSEMLGHTTITLTLDTYSHLIPAMHGDAAAAMDAALSA
jgi:integrase